MSGLILSVKFITVYEFALPSLHALVKLVCLVLIGIHTGLNSSVCVCVCVCVPACLSVCLFICLSCVKEGACRYLNTRVKGDACVTGFRQL